MGEHKRTENRRRYHRRRPKRRKRSPVNGGQHQVSDDGSSADELPPRGEDVEVLIYTYTRYKGAR